MLKPQLDADILRAENLFNFTPRITFLRYPFEMRQTLHGR